MCRMRWGCMLDNQFLYVKLCSRLSVKVGYTQFYMSQHPIYHNAHYIKNVSFCAFTGIMIWPSAVS